MQWQLKQFFYLQKLQRFDAKLIPSESIFILKIRQISAITETHRLVALQRHSNLTVMSSY